MKRSSLSILIVAALACATLAIPGAPASADTSDHFSNIGVSVSGGTVTYSLCIAGQDAPQGGGVTVTDAAGVQYSIINNYKGLSCGPGTFAIVATSSTLLPGTYTFQAAQAFLPSNGVVPPAMRDGSFIAQISPIPDTLARICPTIDFSISPDTPNAAQDCAGAGTAGSLGAIGSAPPPTAVPTSVPTATPTSAPTATPTGAPPPAPTAVPTVAPTSVPTVVPPAATPAAPAASSGGPPAATAAPGGPTVAARGSATPGPTGAVRTATPPEPTVAGQGVQLVRVVPTVPAGPSLRISALSPVVRPGDVARFRVSSERHALIVTNATIPGQRAVPAYGMTDGNGRLSLAVPIPKGVPLSNGRASATVAARVVTGSWRRIALFKPVVSGGLATHIVVSAPAQAYIHAVVSLSGQAELSFYGTTNAGGRFAFDFTVPKTVKKGARAQVSVSALTKLAQAVATSTVAISDMLVNILAGPIVNCVQKPVVHVSYKPNTRLQIVAAVDHGKQLTLAARTDSRGEATVPLVLSYAHLDSPARLRVTAADAGRVQRKEGTVTDVPLPQACRAPSAPPVISVGP